MMRMSDYSEATNEELEGELEAMRRALGVSLGHPLDPESGRNAVLHQRIRTIEAELERRHG